MSWTYNTDVNKRHNMLMVGPPGAGKSMMAKRLPSILPPLNLEEALETTKIYSVSGLMTRRKESDGLSTALIVQRPFRSPHHTVTDVALVGGGANPHPGEISLAHHGVLFLDEHKKKNLCHFLHMSKKSRIFAQNFKIDGEDRAYQRSRIAC